MNPCNCTLLIRVMPGRSSAGGAIRVRLFQLSLRLKDARKESGSLPFQGNVTSCELSKKRCEDVNESIGCFSHLIDGVRNGFVG